MHWVTVWSIITLKTVFPAQSKKEGEEPLGNRPEERLLYVAERAESGDVLDQYISCYDAIAIKRKESYRHSIGVEPKGRGV